MLTSTIVFLSNGTIKQLMTNIENGFSVFDKFQMDHKSVSSEKKNELKNLHEEVRNMVLHAASRDGEITPTTPAKYCLNFFGKTAMGKEKQFFKMLDNRNCLVEVKTGKVTALYWGLFLHNYLYMPSNFSFFLFLKTLMQYSSCSCLVLQIKNMQGNGWLDEDIE